MGEPGSSWESLGERTSQDPVSAVYIGTQRSWDGATVGISSSLSLGRAPQVHKRIGVPQESLGELRSA